jgi:hypothetical protein
MPCSSVDRLPMFQRNLLPPYSAFSTLKLQAASSYKTPVPTQNTTLHQISEDSKFHEYLFYGKQQKHGHTLGTGRGGIQYCDIKKALQRN